ncbi:MAG: tRNA (adenosine(37)-N6)-dimethylallyltransferase MiaA [Prolixibacteraceae bacterium]|nr:tRNA (adenosine(37)-N6)-dimethylallyltransferase MiaA [Prolixibacteraceae bacterium]
MQKNLIVILGPTAIGKTDIAIRVAQHLNTEIISADSRQIFKELQIGTATPNSQQLHTVKHHFIHSHSIHNYYNASKYETEALLAIESILQKNNNVVMSGGSMLYIDAVCKGIDDLPAIDHKIRNEIIERYEKEGLDSLRFELKKIDPDFYAVTDLKNYKRILHALEIFYMTGKPYSSFMTKNIKQRDFNIIKIGLNTDRAILHQRINQRVDQMINDGLVDEARQVYAYKHLNSLNTVGYKELFDYFDNKITLSEAIELIKRNSRRYARRQLTWFNKDKNIKWFEPGDTKVIIDYISETININN